MNDTALYQQAIKALARAAHGTGRLEAATGSAFLDNSLCGDRVRIEVIQHDSLISTLRHETRGCLLCRASASLLGLHAPGQDRDGIRAARDALEQLLVTPPATVLPTATSPLPWPELTLFAPAHPFPSRHGCVLLPFQALLAALGPDSGR
ncbi:MAG: iron-sulfur cluster assembly scaffold protein [Thiothrix sp.]|nr:iron-sulfur cluster assembly scaffold protein [Thiothrix sp.]HPE60855.1 iron-sulfur cluster assembly scaffold protein [Thiolinea sp.]